VEKEKLEGLKHAIDIAVESGKEVMTLRELINVIDQKTSRVKPKCTRSGGS